MTRRGSRSVPVSFAVDVRPGFAQGPHSDTTKPFNGTSLAGWHPQGAAAVACRVGRAGRFGGEWSGAARARQELPGHHPEIRLSVRRLRCRRDAAQRGIDGEAGHDDRALCRDLRPGCENACTASPSTPRVKRLDRTKLYKWTARQNPPGMQMAHHARHRWMDQRAHPGARRRHGAAGGWPRSRRRRHQRLRPPVRPMPIYGPLSLRIGNGEVRIKDLTVTDLLRPAAGIAAEVTSPNFRRSSAHRSLLL